MLSTRELAFVEIQVTYRVSPLDVAGILCHRLKDGHEQLLIRWRTLPASQTPSQAICSWHDLYELTSCMHLIQKYLENRQSSSKPTLKRKRPSPEDGLRKSRDSKFGNGHPTSVNGRSDSTNSRRSSSDAASEKIETPGVYNGVLERREGRVVATQSKHMGVVKVDATSLPTPEMVEQARISSTAQAERYIRLTFERKLKKLRWLRLENKVDSSAPSLDFSFITDYVTGKDVYRADPGSYEGCTEPCKSNMGSHIGCEWPRECKCLEYAAVNEDLLRREDPQLFQEYQQAKQNGDYIDITNLPKRFPYHVSKVEGKPQTLVPFYREERYPIYECNVNCRCGPVCKSRVVQKGRRVPLTIFQTANRGWGVYCDEDLIQGEFIDTYLGEIITNQEADRREQAGPKEKQSYLYSLDKFVDNVEDLTHENCYVVDGQYIGGPTRFINHCCEPNCRQYTVSYDKNNPRIYDIAFFAVHNIPAGTELTFDYQDKDEVEEDVAVRQREAARRDPANAGKQPCNCGARKCRGFLWE
ncbi:uncharacterized protein LTR77_006827 [Saxophila tyrrhenica]|uniref:SET domain-containing protein n=1 Tax=Saxophila tyrrhenica TaxID=1690608 RepID=A0AAV9P6E7_9PEZI|nr:hypothetical protein LTR77_006827 [Saxophila tyrrhenica]